MYKLFLCLRYLRKRRIAFFAIAAVTLCTFMVLTVSSVMGGFLDMVRERSRGLLSDIILDNSSMQGFAYYQEFIDRVKADMPDRIAAATPIIYSYGILRFPELNVTKPVRVVGIRLGEYTTVNDFHNSLFYEKHYPGMTTLKPSRLPVWGPAPDRLPKLPDDLMAARDKWLATVTDPEIRDRYALKDFTEIPYPGPGDFCQLFPDVDEVLETLAEHYNIDVEVLKAPSKDESIRAARRVAMYLAWDMARLDMPAIAEQFGESDPDAIAEIVRAVDKQARDDLNMAKRLGTLTMKLIGPRYAGQPLPGLIIGLELVGRRDDSGEYKRSYFRGEEVILALLPLTRKGAESAQGMKRIGMRYVDDSHTGVYDIDNLCVYGDFDLLQRELGMDPQERADGAGMFPARTSQICIKLAPGADPYEMRDRLQEEWHAFHAALADGIDPDDSILMGGVRAETWEQRQRMFIAAVEKEKVLVTMLFAVISIVAVFLTGCIFYMIAQEKTRDIGIIKSVGASSLGVASMFLSYGAAVGVVGAFLGTTLGIFFVRYINEMQDALVKLNPSLRVWDPAVYTFDRIPNRVDPKEAVVIVCVAIVSSMLGSLAAARRAAKVWPVEALRYE